MRPRSVARGLLLLSLLPALVGFGAVPAAGAPPVRVDLSASEASVPLLSEVPVRLVLRGADGEPAAAPRLLAVRLVGLLVAAAGEETAVDETVSFPAGTAEREVVVQVGRRAGMLELAARSPELLGDEILVRVTPAAAGGAEALPELGLRVLELSTRSLGTGSGETPTGTPPTVTPPPPTLPPADLPVTGASPSQPSPVGGGGGAIGLDPSIMERTLADLRLEIADLDDLVVPADPGPAVGDGASPRLELRVRPNRPLLATGTDPATLYAYRVGGATDGPAYRLNLFADGGRLAATSLEVDPETGVATTTLTSGAPGAVRVEVISVEPRADAAPGQLEVRFAPPVVGLDLVVPEAVPSGAGAMVTARLVGPDGNPVALEEERTVSFTLREGEGRLDPASVEVAAGEFEARTHLEPGPLGGFVVEASSPGLATVRAEGRVVFPWLLLVVAAAGGLAGGLVAWSYKASRRRERLVLRLFIGIVAALVLNWAVVALDLLPADRIDPLLGVFSIAVLGGWLGTEVFDRILAATLGPAGG